MALVGYARVSTREQHPEAQRDALAAAGCAKVFVEHASGKLAVRPQLGEALGYLRDGQDTLVVTKLDRLGRSVANLAAIAADLAERQVGLRAIDQGIDTTTSGGRLFFHLLAAIAEFEHDLIVERTHDGLAAARARGRAGGRRPKLSATQVKAARAMYDSRQFTVAAIAESFRVARSTIYRYLDVDTTTAKPTTRRTR